MYYDIYIYKVAKNTKSFNDYNLTKLYNLEKGCIVFSKLMDDELDANYVLHILADIYNHKKEFVYTDLRQIPIDMRRDVICIEAHENLKDGENFGIKSQLHFLDFLK